MRAALRGEGMEISDGQPVGCQEGTCDSYDVHLYVVGERIDRAGDVCLRSEWRCDEHGMQYPRTIDPNGAKQMSDSNLNTLYETAEEILAGAVPIDDDTLFAVFATRLNVTDPNRAWTGTQLFTPERDDMGRPIPQTGEVADVVQFATLDAQGAPCVVTAVLVHQREPEGTWTTPQGTEAPAYTRSCGTLLPVRGSVAGRPGIGRAAEEALQQKSDVEAACQIVRRLRGAVQREGLEGLGAIVGLAETHVGQTDTDTLSAVGAIL